MRIISVMSVMTKVLQSNLGIHNSLKANCVLENTKPILLIKFMHIRYVNQGISLPDSDTKQTCPSAMLKGNEQPLFHS